MSRLLLRLSLLVWVALALMLGVTLSVNRLRIPRQISYSDGRVPDLYLLDAERGVSLRLWRTVTGETDAVWSPDGKRLALVQNTFTGSDRFQNDAMLVMADLHEGTLVSLAPDWRILGQPAWSPDGSRLAFRTLVNGSSQVAVHQLDTGLTYRLNETSSGDSDPVWTPDGEWLSYLSYRDGNPRLYSARPDCIQEALGCRRNDRLLIPGFLVMAWPPAWSPDGRWLAVTGISGGSNQSALYLFERMCPNLAEDCMRLQHRLTENISDVQGPAWSPDGQWVSFIAYEDARNVIRLLNPFSMETRTYAVGPNTIISQPGWSADGGWLVFEMSNFQLMALEVGSGRLRGLVKLQLPISAAPAWRP